MQDFLWSCCGQCGISSVSDSSLIQLILLKVYMSLPMQMVLTTGFQSIVPVTSKVVSSVYFSLFCLLVSSVSNFCSEPRWAVVVTFFRLTCSVVLWGGRNTANKYHWRVWGVLALFQPRWICPCSQCVCSPSVHCLGSSQALSCSAGNCLMWALCFVHSPGLSRSGSQVLHKGADLVGHAFCARPRSEQLR